MLKQGFSRTDYCGELTERDEGRSVSLCGWVQRTRNLGGLIFVWLRDKTGLVQLVFDQTVCGAEVFAVGESLRGEYVVCTGGQVRLRDQAAVNEKLKTGRIEIFVDSCLLLNQAATPPIYIDDKAEENVSRISNALEGHQVTLLKDIAMLDKLYDINLNYFKELSMYILAGKQKLKIAQEEELPKFIEKAEKSGLPEDAQFARDFSEMCSRFEKKIHDLELTRMVSLQMAPQIRMIQNNNVVMSDKIQSTLVNTIPLWKSQMVIAIGLSHSTEAAAAQRAVSDVTNEMLKKNAEALKLATVETVKESERGIVDIEALKATNQTLITTLDEVMKIQKDGKEKRVAAEAELSRIENEMKQKLLEISQQ